MEMVEALRNATTSTILIAHRLLHFPLDGSTIRADHDYQPPCANNIVDTSKAVWVALGVPKHQWGGLEITWSESDA
ncbi:hypothetical protein RIF29_15160 [Crotalaria pallida]|uniref:Uncharacterized protein n=1 Tax=Crotalaria pallida TaxID=3830 RepID=A0AAN9IAZ0_CROPI